MGLLVFHGHPVVSVGGLYETRMTGCRCHHLPLFAVEPLNIAGEAKIPLALFRRREADDHPVSAIPKCGCGQRAVTRRPNFGLNVYAGIGIRMRCHLLGVELKHDVADRVGRRRFADGLRGGRGREGSHRDAENDSSRSYIQCIESDQSAC